MKMMATKIRQRKMKKKILAIIERSLRPNDDDDYDQSNWLYMAKKKNEIFIRKSSGQRRRRRLRRGKNEQAKYPS